jgi:hypothetical protein
VEGDNHAIQVAERSTITSYITPVKDPIEIHSPHDKISKNAHMQISRRFWGTSMGVDDGYHCYPQHMSYAQHQKTIKVTDWPV